MKTTRGRAVAIAALLAITGSVEAQFGGSGADGRLRPTTAITLDTTGRPQGWDFADIAIPAGVTVHLVGTNPAILRSIGPVVIHGRIEANGKPGSGQSPWLPGGGGPGGYAGGSPARDGEGPAGGQGGSFHYFMGGTRYGHGGHALPGLYYSATPTYGSALPFDLRGGSGGGGSIYYAGGGATLYSSGGGGGGVIVLLADGDISVSATGMVTANGHGTPGMGYGAGGSVMIRSATSVSIQGSVEAAGYIWVNPLGLGGQSGDGWVRIDAGSASPQVTGSIVGVSEVVALPHLDVDDAQLGTAWNVTVTPRPGDDAAVFIAPAPGSVQTPFGQLLLDPGSMALLGMGRATAGAIESTVVLSPPIPNLPALRGGKIHAQALAFDRAGYARLSAPISKIIQ